MGAFDCHDGRLLVLAPLWLEGLALRRGSRTAKIMVTGMGAAAAARAALSLSREGSMPRALAVAGVCGALARGMRPGDVVVATEIRGTHTSTDLASAPALAQALRGRGLTVRLGPVLCSRGVARGAERDRLAAEHPEGREAALVVDMESAWLLSPEVLAAMQTERIALVRVVLDTKEAGFGLPSLPAATRKAFAVLREIGGALESWAQALGPRTVYLGAPRSFCSGVKRAIDTTEAALTSSSRLYVLKEIVHNKHVVGSFRERGVAFVDSVTDVPSGETVVFSAHGVSPQVRALANDRGLRTIDATCPLVARVHRRAKNLVSSGHEVVLIGKKGHDEVEGVVGEAPTRIHVVEKPDDIGTLKIPRDGRVGLITQTTLAQSQIQPTIDRLKERFPDISLPRMSDICNASRDRQEAVRALAAQCELVLVIGSQNSSNSRRLLEESEKAGTKAVLIDDQSELDFSLLERSRIIGLTAGASAPEADVEGMLEFLRSLGPVEVRETTVAESGLSGREKR